MRNTRDYTNLRETAHAREAAQLKSTVFKDYSLAYIGRVHWGNNFSQQRFVQIALDEETCILPAPDLWHVINGIIDEADDDGWLPRLRIRVECPMGALSFDTNDVNQECLRDSVVKMSIGKHTAYVDLEELLRATRYT